MQLKYEFKETINSHDITEAMASNWMGICKRLFPEKKDDMSFTDEKQAMDVLTRNLYHRKPSSLPVEFVQVCVSFMFPCKII